MSAKTERDPSRFQPGSRVRIEASDEPYRHIGKLATVKRAPAKDTDLVQVEVDHSKEIVEIRVSYLQPVDMIPRSLLANELFLPWDPSQKRTRLTAFLDSPWIAGRVLESMLLYDTVVVPTVDFAVIVPLIHWLTPSVFKEALGTDALSFVRYRGTLGYIGNGHGLQMFEIRSNPDGLKEDDPYLRAVNYSPAESALVHLEKRINGLPPGSHAPFSKLIELSTVETSLPEFTARVANETYRDILGGDYRSAGFTPGMNLKKLGGIGANQLRHYSWGKPPENPDPIDTTLRVGMLNLQAYLAEEAGTRDLSSGSDIIGLMRSKYNRYTAGDTAAESFAAIRSIERVPDVVAAVTQRVVTPADVWKLRNTRRAAEFRKWFDEVGPEDPKEMAAEYVSTLKEQSALSSGKAKMLRFGVINSIGIALSLVGGMASVAPSLVLNLADSFLLDRIRLGFKPRYFIDDIRERLEG